MSMGHTCQFKERVSLHSKKKKKYHYILYRKDGIKTYKMIKREKAKEWKIYTRQILIRHYYRKWCCVPSDGPQSKVKGPCKE